MFLANLLFRPSLVSRKEWNAENSKGDIPSLKPEVDHVVVSFTESQACNTKQECTQRVRELQRKHIENDGQPDIAYNFLIGGDGYVYEGRGWKLAPKPYAKTKTLEQLQDNFIEIAFIGRYDNKPSLKMLKALMGLVLKAVKDKVLADVKKLQPCIIVDGKPYYLRDEMLGKTGDNMDKAALLEQYKSLAKA